MTGRRGAIVGVVTALAVLGMLVSIFLLGGLRINLSPSYPIGLWQIEPLAGRPVPGDRVIVCPPPTLAFRLARERGYIGVGLCPGLFAPLIKTVVAGPGQHVGISSQVSIDGIPLAGSVLQSKDGQGRTLTPAGSGIVPMGQLFLHSEFVGSYDSRYFGTVPESGLLGRARPLIVLEP